MRLIDADKLNFLEQHYNKSQMKAILDFLDAQPTAYDVDKVVERLKRCYGIVRSTSTDYAEGLKDAYERAIGIVEGGGMK